MDLERMFVVGAIMLVAGILGGSVTYARTRTERSDRKDWCWAVLIGITASTLVPLLLNTISSNLLDQMFEVNLKPTIPFYFFGFCVLGAISSKVLIETLTDRLLRATQETQEQVSALERQVAPIIDREIEIDETEGESYQLWDGFGEERRKVLKALSQSRFTLRTARGIARDLKRNRGEINDDLEALSKLGLVTEVQGKKGNRWALTPTGREKIPLDA